MAPSATRRLRGTRGATASPTRRTTAASTPTWLPLRSRCARLAVAVTNGAWHEAQLHVVINGTASQTEVWLDGTKISALSKTESLGTTPVGRLQLGDTTTGHTYDIAFDDVVADTTFIQ